MEEEIDEYRGETSGLVDIRSEAETQLVIDELTAASNSLGTTDINDGTYMKDRDCKPCLKEIIRLLNKDDKQHVARQTLGDLNVIKSDLIPLVTQYCDFHEGDKDLFDLVIRLCTNLTSSVFLLFENQEIPTEPELIKIYNKLMKGLYGYKKAFADDIKIWTALNTYLWHTEDEVPFERLLILLRNILHIPVDATSDMGIHSDFDTHSLCLYRMEKSGLFGTIIKIASETKRGSEFCFHIMEIVHLMLRDQNPATVAKSAENRKKRKLDDDDEDKKRLADLSARDKCSGQTKVARFATNPRFKNSLFVVNSCQTLGQNPMLSRRPIGRGDDINFDTGKTELRKSKNRKPLPSNNSSAVISDQNLQPSELTFKLKMFSKHFVEKVYTNYMQQIKHNLIQKKAAENDESYYLWSIQYFTAFSRHLFLDLEHISETMSTSTLHFIQILITSYQDKMKIEKKRSLIEKISKRLHLALRAYREILNLIKTIERESEFWITRLKIQNTLFRELEYSSLLLTLLQQYEESKHCPEYLKDLISANDVFLDLCEQFEKTDDFVVEGESEEQEKENSNDKAPSKRKKNYDLRQRYCCPDIIKSYIQALRDFKKNDNTLNLQILKFLEKGVHDCRCEVMLMQASVFTLFLEIVDCHPSMVGHARFVNLSKHLMSIFTEMINKKRWMIQELLFWKTNSDIVEIEHAIDPPPPPARVPSPGLDEPNDQTALNPDNIISELAVACDESESQDGDDIIGDIASACNSAGSSAPDDIMRDLEAACADIESPEPGATCDTVVASRTSAPSPDSDDSDGAWAQTAAGRLRSQSATLRPIVEDDSPVRIASGSPALDAMGEIACVVEGVESPRSSDNIVADLAAACDDPAKPDDVREELGIVRHTVECGAANDIISDIADACEHMDLPNSQLNEGAQVATDSEPTSEGVKD